MNINPKFEKALHYVRTFMKTAVKHEGHLTVFLKDPEIRKTWSDEERAFMRNAWFVETTGKCDPMNELLELEAEATREELDDFEDAVEETTGVDTPDFDEMTKKQIDFWALEVHGIELDRRKNKTNMLKELMEKLAE